MARKQKQSPLEDIIDITAMLPWQAGVFLAFVAYLVCHHYANTEIPAPASMAQMGANISSQIGKTLATFGQYLLPLVFLTGAGISAFERRKRAKLFEDVQEGSAFHLLNGMKWTEFEMLAGEAFRRRGYTVSETGGGGADGGVDLVLRKDGEKFLVQCKHWKAYQIGVTVIRELYGVMAASGATGGFVVTSGVFSQEAKSFAKGINIDLIDGAELVGLIKRIPRQSQSTFATTQRTPAATVEPSCPKCGSTMTVRVAKQGANYGKTFWGCSGFPRCRGVVSID